MRVPLLIAIATLTTGCTSHGEQTSTTTILDHLIETADTSAVTENGSLLDRRPNSPNPLVGADLYGLAAAVELPAEPASVPLQTAESHQPHEAFTGPSPVPAVPSRFDDPLDLFIWAGHASLNYGARQPFPDPRLRELLSPTLLPNKPTASRPPSNPLLADWSRAVLLDSWMDSDYSTATLVQGVAIFERTLGAGGNSNPNIEIVSISLTAHATDEGWQIVEFRITS